MLAVSISAPGRSAGDHAGHGDLRTVDIIPFEPWHLLWLTETTEEAFLPRTPDYAQSLKEAGPCWTAMAGAEVIACAGVFPYWPERAQAWSVLSADVGRHIFSVHRAVAKFLNAYPCRRVEIHVDPRNPLAVRWATRLGFQYEGTMRAFTPGGHAMDLYARVRE